MKLIPSDIPKLRGALQAAKQAGIANIVIANGFISGLHEKHIAALYSPIELSIDPAISLGVTKLVELQKRLELFGDDVLVEGEENDAKKIRQLNIRGKAGKIQFRCTDERLIQYPKSNDDTPDIVVTITRPEVALLARGTRTLGAELLKLQVTQNGGVHFECSDSNQDGFEVNLEAAAEFLDEPHSYLNPFDVSTGGVILSLLEQLAKDSDSAQFIIMASGNLSLHAYGHDLIVIPRIQHGD